MPLDIEPAYHVPDTELHAYLDQALSRSQCVEIERHLAECPVCRAERDGIAALRDRTTALLAAAAPRMLRPRPYAQLAAEHLQRATASHRRVRNLAWAASLVAAVGLGWGLSHWSRGLPQSGTPDLAGTGAAPHLNPWTGTIPGAVTGRPVAPVRLATAARGTRPGAAPAAPAVASAPGTVAPPRPSASELAAVGGTAAASEPVLDGVWRTVTYAPGAEGQSDWMPRVDGVPVVQVKVRQAPQGGRPITLVTQQLASGEMISTVEGPSVEVAALLSRQSGQSASAELQDMELKPAAGDSAAARRAAPTGGPRTLAVFGSAPSDSLKAFMLRVK